MKIFNEPVHPLVKSVAPGGGFGAGIGYKRDRKTGGPWLFGSYSLVFKERKGLVKVRRNK
jgi:hypothetical protein